MTVPDSIGGVLRAIPSAALLVASDGALLLANRAAREQLGFPTDAPGGSILDLTEDTGEVVRTYLRMWARSPDPIPGGLRVRIGDRVRPFVVHGSLVARRAGEMPALLVVRLEPRDATSPFILLSQTVEELQHEIRRRREAEDALRDRALEAEEANRLKDEFLAALSHELRTPLNAILGWTELLREGPLDASRQARGLEVIARNARIQVQLIDELLDISRIVAGKMRLSVQPLDPAEPIEAAIETIRPALEAKAIRLQTVLDPQAGPIHGDPDRLQQIVWNLLSNATKFTPKGGRIQLVLARVESSVEISVSDSGEGITPEFLPHVFERFRQQEGSISRVHGGLGLGLSIVKSLVELHGGTVRATSEGPGRGATFVVRLPRAIVRSEPTPRPFATSIAPMAHVPPRTYLEGLRILVVDDERDAAEMLAAILQEFGAVARFCTSAAEVLDAVASATFDLLISDIGMPHQDGYQLITQLRALPADRGGELPAIALTAFARSEDRTRALTAGFQAHLPKPVELAELLAVVGSVTGRRGSGRTERP